jgi:hypothetical protein
MVLSVSASRFLLSRHESDAGTAKAFAGKRLAKSGAIGLFGTICVS